MTLTAALSILISAVIHASWNLLSKRSKPTIPFFLAATASTAIFLSPVSAIYKDLLMKVPASVWRLLVLTGSFQALYYVGLAVAYLRGELSVVYPIIRALPVLTVAGVSLVLNRSSQVYPMGLLGMGLVALGCWLLPQKNLNIVMFKRWQPGDSPDFEKDVKEKSFRPDLVLALLAVLGTTGYTITDDLGLALMRELPMISDMPGGAFNASLAYAFIETLFTLPWLAGLSVLFPQKERPLRSYKLVFWRNAALTGVLIFIAYGLVLFAMAFVRDVSYVAAFRQVSIPLGALLGFLVEKEPVLPQKIAGLLIAITGLTLVAIG